MSKIRMCRIGAEHVQDSGSHMIIGRQAGDLGYTSLGSDIRGFEVWTACYRKRED